MTQPAENVPTDDPARHGQTRFLFRSEGTVEIHTIRVRTVNQFANQVAWTREGVEAMMAVVALVHHTPTLPAPRIFNLQDNLSPNQVLSPMPSHSRCLRATTS